MIIVNMHGHDELSPSELGPGELSPNGLSPGGLMLKFAGRHDFLCVDFLGQEGLLGGIQLDLEGRESHTGF